MFQPKLRLSITEYGIGNLVVVAIEHKRNKKYIYTIQLKGDRSPLLHPKTTRAGVIFSNHKPANHPTLEGEG